MIDVLGRLPRADTVPRLTCVDLGMLRKRSGDMEQKSKVFIRQSLTQIGELAAHPAALRKKGADRSPCYSAANSRHERQRVNACFAPSIAPFARSIVSVRRLGLLPGSVLGRRLRGGHR